jgi:hypothetical protein
MIEHGKEKRYTGTMNMQPILHCFDYSRAVSSCLFRHESNAADNSAKMNEFLFLEKILFLRASDAFRLNFPEF